MCEPDILIPGHGVITSEARRPLRTPARIGNRPAKVWATGLGPALRVWLDGRAPANEPCLQPVGEGSRITIPNSAPAAGKSHLSLTPIDQGGNHA
jgi:hypothetical protein